jgi:hypothetical protein
MTDEKIQETVVVPWLVSMLSAPPAPTRAATP